MRLVVILASAAALAIAAGAGARSNVSALPLGIAGDPARFQDQTGQRSAIQHAFLGWGQGVTWGRRIVPLLQGLGPIPMIHLGIGNARRKPVISPRDIANGRGDAYLVGLNAGIAEYGGLVYVRPMAEMNNPNTFYSPVTKSGRSRGPAYSAAAYRAAFCRIFVILHGGTRAMINAALRACSLPPLGAREDLPANPKSRLKVIWNPLAGLGGWKDFYPGDRWVDLVGNDMYGSGGDFSRPQNEELYAFARAHHKRYSLPEWGVSVDQPEFVRYICDFIKSRTKIVLAAYYDSKAGSPWDLANKPNSKQTYRACITPLGANA